MTFLIRPVEQRDYEDCISMFRELGERYTLDSEDQQVRSIFETYTRHENKLGFVAFDPQTGERVACLFVEIASLLCKGGKQGRGEGMVTKPQYRGHGVGRALLAKAAEVMKERGVRDFVIRTPNSFAALNFYRSIPEAEERGVYFYYKLH